MKETSLVFSTLIVLTRCGSEEKPPPVQPLPVLECPSGTTFIEVRPPSAIICQTDHRPPPPPKIITITTTITTTVAVQSDPLLVVLPSAPQEGSALVGQRLGLAHMQLAAYHRNIYLRRLRQLQIPGSQRTLEQIKLHMCLVGGPCYVVADGQWNETDQAYNFPFKILVIMEPNSRINFSAVAEARATGFVKTILNPVTAFDAVDEQGKPVKVEGGDYFDWGWQFVSALEAQAAPDAPLSEELVSGEMAQTIGKLVVVDRSRTATTLRGIAWRLSTNNDFVCRQAKGCALSLVNSQGSILWLEKIESGEPLRFEGVLPFLFYITIRLRASASFTLIADTRDAPADTILWAEVNNLLWQERPDNTTWRFRIPFNLIVGRQTYH